jgi:exodeoxyribonuclease VII large subunit
VTLADLAADCRALTPSAAGENAVPDCREVALHLDRLADRIRQAGQAQIDLARAKLARLAQRSQLALRQDLLQRRHRLARLAASLEALSPLAVLSRGFSLTFHHDGNSLIRSADQVHPGQLIHTKLASGQIASRVESTS